MPTRRPCFARLVLVALALSATACDAPSRVLEPATASATRVDTRSIVPPNGGGNNGGGNNVAGNTATATTSFTIAVHADDLCALARELVPRHATPLCAQLRSGTRAFANHLKAQRGKQVPTDVADLLARLAAGR